MGVIQMYLCIILIVNHTREINSFDFNDLIASGRDLMEHSWNKITNVLSDSFEAAKDFIMYPKQSDLTEHISRQNDIPRKRWRTGFRRKLTKIIGTLNYRLESHMVLTTDGYILNLHRVLATGNRSGSLTNKTALLHHGLLGSSADWLLAEEEHCLPFLLSTEGYDVWLANARGNDYSNAHVTKPRDSEDFWDFTFQEMGQYDLPAVIDYIIKANKQKVAIDFVGYSMGASAFLVLTSTMPKYQEFFQTAVLLAPLAFMFQVKGPLKMLATLPENELNRHGAGEFFASRKITRWVARKYCVGREDLCSNPLFFLAGAPSAGAQKLTRIQNFVPSGGSTKTILHYCKLVKSGLFSSFMGSVLPIGKISVPVFLMSARGDMVASVEGVAKLSENLGKPVHHRIIDGNFTHTDFLWSSAAKHLVFELVVDYLKSGETYNAVKENEIF